LNSANADILVLLPESFNGRENSSNGELNAYQLSNTNCLTNLPIV